MRDCQREARQLWVEDGGRKVRTHPNLDVFDLGEVRLDVVLALPILEQLTQRERRRPLHPQLGQHTPERKHIHLLRHLSISLPKLQSLLLPRHVRVGGVEALWRDVARTAGGCVEEEGEDGGIVEGEEGRLERGGEIRDEGPVPRSDEDVFGLYVAVGDLVEGERGERQFEGERLEEDERRWKKDLHHALELVPTPSAAGTQSIASPRMTRTVVYCVGGEEMTGSGGVDEENRCEPDSDGQDGRKRT